MAGEGSRRNKIGAECVEAAPFGVRLKRLREAAGLTQEELADRAGLTARGISDLERGKRRRPYPHTVKSLAEALGLSGDERAALLAAVPGRGDVAATGAAVSVAALLPTPPTRLVGRECDLREVAELLCESQARLVTLTGPGGVGKTRLAIEAVREAAGLFSDGAVFVPLASLGDPDLVLPTIARSLGLRETGGHSPREVLHAYLREKRFLLALDNFEHVLGAAPEVSALIAACQELTVLATSRAPLRLRGEQEYPVGPLALPASTISPAVEAVAGSASGRLFLERARAASPAFQIIEENAGAVAAICRRLDGLPLALELAAARARFLDPTALLVRLDRALEAGSLRDLPQRQRTMRRTLDWSHDLLHNPEKELFRRLSVFAGGFTIEAAEAVGGNGGLRDEDVLLLLGNLVEQSLVLAEPDEEGYGIRYRMLEPIRQYALERLRESGEEDGVQRQHAKHYLALAEEAEPRIKGHEQVKWLDRLEAENDNLRAAIGRSLEVGEAQTAARFGWALGMYWVMRARHGEGQLLMEQTLSQGGDLPTLLQAKAIWALATCVYGTGNNERMMAVAEEGVALSRRVGDRHGQAYTLAVLGFAALQLGDFDLAKRVLEESLEIAREQGDAWGCAIVTNHLAVVALNRGDPQRAARYAEEALALTRQTGDRLAANISLSLLAQMAWASGEHERAARHWREALAMASELANKVDSAYCMQGLAAVSGAQGEALRAAHLIGAADALLEAAGLVLYAYAGNELHAHAVSSARELLGDQAWNAARAEGRAMTFEEAVAYGLEGEGTEPSHFSGP